MIAMNKHSILIIVENLPVPFDRRVWSEATALTRLGYAVTVLCPKMGQFTKTHEVLDGVRIYRHPMPKERGGALGYLIEYAAALFWELLFASYIFLRHGFSVIHACNPPDLIFLVAAPFKLLFGTKFIFDHHDLNPELYEAKFSRRDFFWRLLCIAERMTFRLADASIATNQSYANVAIERGKMDPAKVFVVRSGPNLDRIRPVKPNDKWKAGKRILVGYVGVIGEQEGVDLLVDAIDILVRQNGRKDIQFVIIGDGPALPSIAELVKTKQLHDHITLTGRVDDALFLEILSTADLCVNPDRPNELNDKSTMNKIVEYMALAKPIVQFNLTEGRVSAQEASLYAKNTDVADFAANIALLADNPKRRKAMGEAGFVRVKKHLSWPHEVPNLAAAYESVLSAPAECVKVPR